MPGQLMSAEELTKLQQQFDLDVHVKSGLGYCPELIGSIHTSGVYINTFQAVMGSGSCLLFCVSDSCSSFSV